MIRRLAVIQWCQLNKVFCPCIKPSTNMANIRGVSEPSEALRRAKRETRARSANALRASRKDTSSVVQVKIRISRGLSL